MDDIETNKAFFNDVRKDMNSTINFCQHLIEINRAEIQNNFFLRLSMLLFHEALQSGRGFLLLTKDDSIDYPAGAVILLRNGFESIVWGSSCLDDKQGRDLVEYIWDHQDIILERDMRIYKKWKLPISNETSEFLEAAKKKMDSKVAAQDNQFIVVGKPLRHSFETKHVKKVFKDLVGRNGFFRYFYETSYKLSTNVWHSSAFSMKLTQYEEVKYYFLANVGNGFTYCLKIFCNESIKKFTGSNDLGTELYRGMSESLKRQIQEIEKGKDIKVAPSVNLVIKFKE